MKEMINTRNLDPFIGNGTTKQLQQNNCNKTTATKQLQQNNCNKTTASKQLQQNNLRRHHDTRFTGKDGYDVRIPRPFAPSAVISLDPVGIIAVSIAWWNWSKLISLNGDHRTPHLSKKKEKVKNEKNERIFNKRRRNFGSTRECLMNFFSYRRSPFDARSLNYIYDRNLMRG
jgi:hypothetical protein